MIFQHFFVFLIITLVDLQLHVKAHEQIYECYINTDFNIYTWHPKDSSPVGWQYQDCSQSGFRILVKNQFISYKVKISQTWMVDAELFFFNGTSMMPFCLLMSEGSAVYADDDVRCQNYGITWSLTRCATQYVISISHAQAQFYTTIQFNNGSQRDSPNFNIYTWQPASLAQKSTGLCTQSDPECVPPYKKSEAKIAIPLELTTDASCETTLSTTAITTTIITTTVPQVTGTTTVPVTTFKCGIYQDMYIQTWHPVDQAFPPIRNCFGITANFQLVTNNYISYTIHTNGSIIDELSLVLFDLTSTAVICNVTAIGQNIAWTNCEQNGINPSLIHTPTHEQLTIDYSAGNFKTIVTRDTSFYFGRFNIIIYLNPESAFQSNGVCNLASSCT